MLEPLGGRLLDQSLEPDAGIWEYRGRTHVHTYSAAMCWVACDRLSRIAAKLGLAETARPWRRSADDLRETIFPAAGTRTELLHRQPQHRRDRRQRAAVARTRNHCGRRPAVRCHRREGRATSRTQRPCAEIRRPTTSAHRQRRSRSARSGMSTRSPRLGVMTTHAGSSRGPAGAPEPYRSAVGGHRPRDRRTLGQLSPDLLDGWHHRRGDAAVEGRGAMNGRALRTGKLSVGAGSSFGAFRTAG